MKSHKQKPIVIFGTGVIAELAYFYFTHDSPHEVAAFTGDAARIPGSMFLGLPCIAFEEVERAFPPSQFDMFVAIGYTDINRIRQAKCREARQKGYTLANYISSRAVIWNDNIITGDNCFIMELNNIQPYVKIGNNVTLWSGNHIGHHSVIEDDCFVASHAVISGNVTVGKGSFVGVNATLRDNIRIGEYCVIGAGALIMADSKDYAVYSSAPSKKLPLRSNELSHL